MQKLTNEQDLLKKEYNMVISKETAKKLIYDTLKQNNGAIFSVQFIKKDGTIRDMTARLGVKKHLKGGEQPYNPADYNLITAFDMAKKEYRMISIDTLLKIKLSGQTFEVK
jgi:hypothetical protein